MDMIDEEITRLKNRQKDLKLRIIADLENKTQQLYSQIISQQKDSDERVRHEAEYKRLSKELRLRSDELVKIHQQIENLQLEKSLRR